MAYRFTKLQLAWIEALKNRTYPQTIGRLERTRAGADTDHPAGMCCLGVACMVTKTPRNADEFDFHVSFGPEGDEHDTVLPEQTWKKLRLRNATGMFSDTYCVVLNRGRIWVRKDASFRAGDQLIYNLTEANDYGASHRVIGSFIETYPRIVFAK